MSGYAPMHRFRTMIPARLRRALALAAAAMLFAGQAAWSQAPRTIRIVVPFAPGGPTDVMARLMAEEIGRAQGPTIIVENRPGASTVIGTEAVAHAAPDGATLLIVAPSFVINPHLRKLNYSPLTSFAPICNLVSAPTVMLAPAMSPYRTLADLIGAARAKPGAVTLATNGSGSSIHIASEMLKRAANVDITLVPYTGTAPVINALVGGHVTAAFTDYLAASEQVKSGNLRMLAVASPKRVATLPDVPTLAEAGYGGIEADAWFGVAAPAQTPPETLAQLAGWFTAALRAPEVQVKVANLGLFSVGTCGADFAAFVRKQYDDLGRVIREANIRAE
jgi:tripartite-type tricarboxylate transporter receptor subunit TctC